MSGGTIPPGITGALGIGITPGGGFLTVFPVALRNTKAITAMSTTMRIITTIGDTSFFINFPP